LRPVQFGFLLGVTPHGREPLGEIGTAPRDGKPSSVPPPRQQRFRHGSRGPSRRLEDAYPGG